MFVIVAICLLMQGVDAQQPPDTPSALVQLFYDSYPNELDGGLPEGDDLHWLSRFLSDRLHGRFREVLAYQQEWTRQNPDRPPYYLKPPFADGVHFTGAPDAISSFEVSSAEIQAPGVWHVPIHFWNDPDLIGWQALVVVKEQRSRYVIDDVIFLPAQPGDELWCLSESLQWDESG